ncbi:PEP-CTERM sorting domain-containing protein [Haloferula sp.]|uniref:PEP-CTERM sorting domain-containing protein n=1 Tax=Haloferula sp. TaxID=2497595 RepID=UPI00329EBB99
MKPITKALSLALAPLLISSSPAAIFFDFRDDGAADQAENLDGGGVGATMMGTDGPDTATLTTIDIRVLEYEESAPGVWTTTGETLSAADGDAVTTNVSGQDALGINNPSINNTAHDTIGAGAESSDLNTGEAWVFSFDETVTFDNIEFESVVAGNLFTVFVDGSSILTLDGEDSNVSGSDLGALDGYYIYAGSEITFEAGGPVLDTDYRIESFTVSVVPEPSTSVVALLGLGALCFRRNRRTA